MSVPVKTSMKRFQDIYKSKRVSAPLKVRTFNAYSASVFLYNSELWVLTDTLEKQIDSFHRKMLRRVINIFWPKVNANERLYEKTGTMTWSTIIRKRRLNWLGHLMRLDKKRQLDVHFSNHCNQYKRREADCV